MITGNMHGKIVVSILLALLLIIVGWTLGQVLENISPFTLDWSISLPDVLAIVVELFLACYIARLIEKGIQDQRVEKDFFINELSDTQQTLSELERSCSGTTNLSLYVTVYEVEKARKNLQRIWGIMSVRNKVFHKKNNNDFEKLVILVKMLNSQLTDSNFFTSDQGYEPVKITKGHIYLNRTVQPEIGKTFGKIKDSLFDWKIRINNM